MEGVGKDNVTSSSWRRNGFGNVQDCGADGQVITCIFNLNSYLI